MEKIKYAYAQPVIQGEYAHAMGSNIVRYLGQLYHILIYTDTKEELARYPALQKSCTVCTCIKEWDNIRISDIIRDTNVDETPVKLIEHVRKILADNWITNAMTFFVDEMGNSRRKSVLTRMIGRDILKKLLSKSMRQTCMVKQDAIKIAEMLWWDLKKELIVYFQNKWVTNSLELLAYRRTYKTGYFINQHYINICLNDNKPEWHLSLPRALEFVRWLWWDIYDDILSAAQAKNKKVTDIILEYFLWNNNPLIEMNRIIPEEKQKSLKQKVLDELIWDIKMAWIPRELFGLMWRWRLQRQLNGINLYRRLSMLLWRQIGQISRNVRMEFLNQWKEKVLLS